MAERVGLFAGLAPKLDQSVGLTGHEASTMVGGFGGATWLVAGGVVL